jgi:hypothetical protein
VCTDEDIIFVTTFTYVKRDFLPLWTNVRDKYVRKISESRTTSK